MGKAPGCVAMAPPSRLKSFMQGSAPKMATVRIYDYRENGGLALDLGRWTVATPAERGIS